MRNGAFDFGPYFAATWLVAVIVEGIVSVFNLPAYFIIGLGATAQQFFIFWVTLVLVYVWSISLGLCVGSVAKDVPSALAMLMPILLPLLLFAGFAIPFPVIGGWVFAYYLSPFQYVLSIIQINQFENFEFTSSAGLGFPYSGGDYLASVGLSPTQIPRDFGILVAMNVATFVAAFVAMRVSYRRNKLLQ
jgi:ABC-type multidrug transport system permease subunit